MNWLERYFRGDRMIWLVVMILFIFSVLAVYSSTGTLAYKYKAGNTEYYLFKHMIIILFGFGLMYMFHLFDYTVFLKFAKFGLFISIPLLVLTLLTGTDLNEAKRWLTLPLINLSFQTSDFAKLALLVFVARSLSKKQDHIKDFKTAFVPIILPIILVCFLILPANFSTAAVLFSTCLILMFIGRIKMKFIGALVLAGILTFGMYIGMAKLMGFEGRISTWQNRIENFSQGESGENYQSEQAKIAIASGGVIGKGPGNSTQRNFLPHPYSDFIFAIIIEEYGLIGAVLLIALYLILFYRTLKIVNKSPLAFATLLSIGCAFSLVFQAFINMAVAVNLFPVTGQPLPLISMGGTSIWFTSLAIGIILSVSRKVEKENNDIAFA
ncbi:MAG: FtsW/RodA/SpoVE family cell cycle protein [Bacteroidia bacterium]|nr:FtsW/RodA/SpoVE family cell cycle protein [Bacteroidia bacterium]